MEMDDPVPTWCKHMQDLPKDSVRRLWKEKKADAVQNTGCLQLPEQKINALCRTCRRKGTKLRVSTHKTHKGEHCRECRCTKCGVYQAYNVCLLFPVENAAIYAPRTTTTLMQLEILMLPTGKASVTLLRHFFAVAHTFSNSR